MTLGLFLLRLTGLPWRDHRSSLIIVMLGRRAGLDDLTGEGLGCALVTDVGSFPSGNVIINDTQIAAGSVSRHPPVALCRRASGSGLRPALSASFRSMF